MQTSLVSTAAASSWWKKTPASGDDVSDDGYDYAPVASAEGDGDDDDGDYDYAPAAWFWQINVSLVFLEIATKNFVLFHEIVLDSSDLS